MINEDLLLLETSNGVRQLQLYLYLSLKRQTLLLPIHPFDFTLVLLSTRKKVTNTHETLKRRRNRKYYRIIHFYVLYQMYKLCTKCLTMIKWIPGDGPNQVYRVDS